MAQHFGPIGSYTPTEDERIILMKHLREYATFEPHTPQRDDEVNATQRELLPIDLHDWQKREIRHWFDYMFHKELGVTYPDIDVSTNTTYQRDFDEPAKLRVTTRKKR
jgi:hypothetical protein